MVYFSKFLFVNKFHLFSNFFHFYSTIVAITFIIFVFKTVLVLSRFYLRKNVKISKLGLVFFVHFLIYIILRGNIININIINIYKMTHSRT